MKLIIDIDNNDYELINKTCVTYDWHTVFHGKEKDKEMTFAVFDLVKALKNGIPYEEKPQGKWINETTMTDNRMFFRCSHCNAYNNDRSNFCPDCGADMRSNEDAK